MGAIHWFVGLDLISCVSSGKGEEDGRCGEMRVEELLGRAGGKGSWLGEARVFGSLRYIEGHGRRGDSPGLNPGDGAVVVVALGKDGVTNGIDGGRVEGKGGSVAGQQSHQMLEGRGPSNHRFRSRSRRHCTLSTSPSLNASYRASTTLMFNDSKLGGISWRGNGGIEKAGGRKGKTEMGREVKSEREKKRSRGERLGF
ncbi:hypothetical protein Syun_019442 [Stephania yunnanensis]|uniref:Uncharacterized protein n=1 Tax=Stephania yunnanensis TaxID=152371 RepID=A0AAP0NY02_9MAGN